MMTPAVMRRQGVLQWPVSEHALWQTFTSFHQDGCLGGFRSCARYGGIVGFPKHPGIEIMGRHVERIAQEKIKGVYVSAGFALKAHSGKYTILVGTLLPYDTGV